MWLIITNVHHCYFISAANIADALKDVVDEYGIVTESVVSVVKL